MGDTRLSVDDRLAVAAEISHLAQTEPCQVDAHFTAKLLQHIDFDYSKLVIEVRWRACISQWARQVFIIMGTVEFLHRRRGGLAAQATNMVSLQR